MQATFLEFSRETFSVILKRTEHNNGKYQSLPYIMRKRDAIASLSHITNMKEMNKSNKVITYLRSEATEGAYATYDYPLQHARLRRKASSLW